MEREQYLKFAAVDRQHWWFKARRAVVSAILRQYLPASQTPQRTLLDIGCGTGGMLPMLCQFGNVTATEPDVHALQWTQEQYQALQPPVTFLSGGWETLALPNKGMDVLTAFDVLEHCKEDTAALQQWRTWLKPGGLMVLTVPAFPCLWGLNDEVSHHYRRYTRATLRQVMTRAGLQVEKLSYMNCAMFLPVWLSRNLKDRLQQLMAGQVSLPADFDLPPAPLNDLFTALYAWEQHWLPQHSMPWGTSLVAVARA